MPQEETALWGCSTSCGCSPADCEAHRSRCPLAIAQGRSLEDVAPDKQQARQPCRILRHTPESGVCQTPGWQAKAVAADDGTTQSRGQVQGQDLSRDTWQGGCRVLEPPWGGWGGCCLALPPAESSCAPSGSPASSHDTTCNPHGVPECLVPLPEGGVQATRHRLLRRLLLSSPLLCSDAVALRQDGESSLLGNDMSRADIQSSLLAHDCIPHQPPSPHAEVLQPRLDRG